MSCMPAVIWVDEARCAWCASRTDGIGREYPTEYRECTPGGDAVLAIEEVAGFGYGNIGRPVEMLTENEGWQYSDGYAAFYARHD